MANCLLALGSNLGDRKQHLSNAVEHLREHDEIDVVAVSRFHPTEAAGGPRGQDPFLNGAMLVQTALAPEQLLRATQTVEERLGRSRDVHWGPRSIDVDLLLYEDVVCSTDRLELPHPWMVARRFVIEPAAEIAAELVHPELGWTLKRLQRHLRETPNRLAVEGIVGLNLGRQLHQRVSASLIADPVGRSGQDRSSIPDRAQPIEWVQCRSHCLSASAWCDHESCVISEFWFAEAAVVARATLQGAELAAFEECLNQAVRTLPVPKLLILCRRSATTGTSQGPEDWAALRRLVRGQHQYPWLEIPVASEDQVIDQIVAAFQSMQ